MNTQSVKVLVPPDSGFASGGGSIKILFYALNALEWIFSPVSKYRQRRNYLQHVRTFEQANVRAGKNPDGSYVREFLATTPLKEVLSSLGFDISFFEKGDVFCTSVVLEHFDTPVSELTKEQINKAILECYIVKW